MTMRSCKLLAGFLCTMCAAPAMGQFRVQEFDLQQGWNSVYLEVDPADNDADTVFVTQPPGAIDTVWTWSPEQPGRDSWRVWVPANDPDSMANSLRTITGGRTYQIKANAAATLTIRGIPNPSKTNYKPGFNAVGFHVDTTGPTFETFLAPSPAHNGARIFEMNASGEIDSVPSAMPIQKGHGYWVESTLATTYDGPLDIESRSLRGLVYDRRRVEFRFEFANRGTQPRTVSLDILPSDDPPAGQPGNAGVIPLQRRDYDSSADVLYEMFDLSPGNGASFELTAAGQPAAREVVRISVVRAGASAASLDADGNGSQYQALARINDGAGFERFVPVSAQVGGSGARGEDTGPAAGLYVGSVSVDHVAWVQADARIVQRRPGQPESEIPFDPFFDCNNNGISDLNEFPGTCSTVTCDRGINDGERCTTDADCPILGTCPTVTCNGGTNDGELCTTDGDCPFPEICSGEVCAGGINEGESCTTDDDCPGTCPVITCHGGTNIGEPCKTDDDCPNTIEGSCNAETCDGGTNDGDPCTADVDCPFTIEGTCSTVTCIGGVNEGGPCTADVDCPFQDTCSAMICSGGAGAGTPCTTDDDCLAPPTCIGGADDGESCTTDDDCPNTIAETCNAGTCEGGINNGDPCTTDDDCPITDEASCNLNPDVNHNGILDECEGVTDTTTPRPVSNPLVFPIIIHHDGTSYRFLREVTLLFRPPINPGTCEAGTCSGGTNDGGACRTTEDCPHGVGGRYVLATPGCTNCDELLAGSIINGERFAQRISTIAYSFDDHIHLTGTFDTNLTGETTVGDDDRLNPFRHTYHPNHNDGNEIYDVKRSFGLSFGSGCTPPPGFGFECGAQEGVLNQPGSGDSYLEGCYFETLSGADGDQGLHKRDINLCGTFLLQRISDISVLNDGQ